MKYEGYHEESTLPIKAGDRVRIRKGTTVRNLLKGKGPAGRTYTVTVHHVLPGITVSGQHEMNPMVCWPGTGGYWSEADINDVEKIEPAE